MYFALLLTIKLDSLILHTFNFLYLKKKFCTFPQLIYLFLFSAVLETFTNFLVGYLYCFKYLRQANDLYVFRALCSLWCGASALGLSGVQRLLFPFCLTLNHPSSLRIQMTWLHGPSILAVRPSSSLILRETVRLQSIQLFHDICVMNISFFPFQLLPPWP